MTVYAILAALIVIVLGIPVAFAFGYGALLIYQDIGDLRQIASVAYRGIDLYPFLAVPFFLLSGVIMRAGGISRRLLGFVSVFMGRIRGGIGASMLGASSIFGAISGSSIATVSAMGSIVGPEMRARGYPVGYVGGITSVAGLLGILIPPSVPMIVYGIASGVSILELFLSGAVAGLMLLAAMVTVNLLWARRRPFLRDDLSAAEAMGEPQTTSLRKITTAIPALVLPVVVLGGIYGGYFTPTEAGAVACLGAVVIGTFVYRAMNFRTIGNTLLEGMLSTGAILIIIAFGATFARGITLLRIPADLVRFVVDADLSFVVFLIALNALLLVVGMFVEENTAIIILTPLLLPVAETYGIDPVHFGVIMVLNLGIGLATPPMAPNVFVACRACEVPFQKMVGTTVRFLLLAALPVLIVVNVAPDLLLFHR